MTNLMIELFEILDKECKNNDEWEKNKPIIINVYMGEEHE